MITKINTNIRIKGGFRYFSLRYLKHIIEKGTCHIYAPSSYINVMWQYEHEFVPAMEASGWKKETITIGVEDGLISN